MTLAVYPLVYLPVAASLRGADPGQEEIARSLGASRMATFFRITLGQARRAILGGCLLVALVILAEYGAFEILGYQTFTTEIFTEFTIGFDTAAACALSLVLVVLEPRRRSSARLPSRRPGQVKPERARRPAGACPRRARAGEAPRARRLRAAGPRRARRARSDRRSTGSSRAERTPLRACRSVLRRSTPRATAPLPRLVATCDGAAGRSPRRPPSQAGSHLLLERTTFLVLAMPGLVVALALSYFSEHDANGFGYQTAPLLILAYASDVLPARARLRACLGRPGARRPGGGGGLARGAPARRSRRVTLPARRARDSAAAFCLVFLSAVTELTATLILIPTGARDAGHAVLGLPAEPLLRSGGAVRARHHRHRRGAELRAGPILRSPSRFAGVRSPVRSVHEVNGLEVAGVHKSYGAQPVLRGLDLAIDGGLVHLDPRARQAAGRRPCCG